MSLQRVLDLFILFLAGDTFKDAYLCLSLSDTFNLACELSLNEAFEWHLVIEINTLVSFLVRSFKYNSRPAEK